MCVLQWLFVPLMKLFVYESKGFANVPKSGPVIFVANHASYIDGPLLRYFAEWHAGRLPRGIQSREWLEKGWFRKFLFVTLLGQIPTDGSIAKAIEVLNRGESIMLFPEGSRSATGKIGKTGHTGLGVLAAATKAKVVPVGIEGSFAWWSKTRALPSFRRCIAVRVGKPFTFAGAKTKQNYIAFQNKVMNAVAKLAKVRIA
jgi:1-acyl-sn-glycerol-3-phosphate acyltransferase